MGGYFHTFLDSRGIVYSRLALRTVGHCIIGVDYEFTYYDMRCFNEFHSIVNSCPTANQLTSGNELCFLRCQFYSDGDGDYGPAALGQPWSNAPTNGTYGHEQKPHCSTVMSNIALSPRATFERKSGFGPPLHTHLLKSAMYVDPLSMHR